MNKVYYSQVDSRWKNYPYPSKALPKATIGSGGCGATSAAMIASSLRQIIFPNQMGDIFRNNGLRVNGGTSQNAFPWIAQKYDLEMKKSIYINDAVECLKRGGMCVAYLQAKSLFADGGHIIVLAGMKDDNTIIVYDPYLYNNKFNIVYKGVDRRNKVKLNGNEVYISIENFKKYNNYTLYCYEPTAKYFAGQNVEIHIPIAQTGAVEGDKFQVESDTIQNPNTGSKQFWIHKTVINNSQIVARATICFVSGTSYIVQVFDDQFWVKESDIVKVL